VRLIRQEKVAALCHTTAWKQPPVAGDGLRKDTVSWLGHLEMDKTPPARTGGHKYLARTFSRCWFPFASETKRCALSPDAQFLPARRDVAQQREHRAILVAIRRLLAADDTFEREHPHDSAFPFDPLRAAILRGE
jgi:hypothetical protein